MGFTQGVQAGTQAAQRWGGGQRQKSNPFAAMGAIDATLKQLNKRLHPAVIRNTAAGMANQEKAIALNERKQDFIESQAAIAQREREDQRRWAAEKRVADDLNKQAGIAEEKLPSPGEEYREGMGEIRTQEKHEWGMSKAKQGEDFKVVQWAVANRQAGPIVEFVNRYGSQSANLRGISWNEKGEVLVFPEGEGQQPGYFKNNEEFMKSFVGFLNPKVESQALKIALKERDLKRKEQKTQYDISTKKGSFTQAQLANFRAKAVKAWQEENINLNAEVKKGAMPKDEYVRQYMEKVTGIKSEGVIPEDDEQTEKPPEKDGAEYETFNDPKTGNKLHVYPDGRREVLDPSGKVLATRGGKESGPKKGTQYDRTKEGVPTAKGKIQAIEEGGKSEKVPEKAKRKATARGTATYTDPKTGKKMKAIMNPDGTITTEEVEDTKKKKRPEGYGKKGYKVKSINK